MKADAIKAHLAKILGGDRALQGASYQALLQESEEPVDWAYLIWDDLRRALSHKDNRARSIAAQLLCNLSKSDPENRIMTDFPALVDVTRDERFVTARHGLQALWKVGRIGVPRKSMVVDGLASRFLDCASEKNCTLIRFDIIQALKSLHDSVGDDFIRLKALELIGQEPDLKYRGKYAAVWKKR